MPTIRANGSAGSCRVDRIRIPAYHRPMALELTFLGTGTSAGVPMIGCPCPVCASSDPRDRRDRSSVVVRHPRAKPDSNPDAPDLFNVLIDAAGPI